VHLLMSELLIYYVKLLVFSSEIRDVYEIMWKNTVEPDR
jgi:hypothetical protein